MLDIALLISKTHKPRPKLSRTMARSFRTHNAPSSSIGPRVAALPTGGKSDLPSSLRLLTPCSRDERGPEYSIFVGDLGPRSQRIRSRFALPEQIPVPADPPRSCQTPISGMSRGYGFVRFSEEGDQQRALTEMQGVYCGNRPMRISTRDAEEQEQRRWHAWRWWTKRHGHAWSATCARRSYGSLLHGRASNSLLWRSAADEPVH
ncbi:hypothetical protein MRB53_038093 [Persea americana]|nr:hypothetical protein MRB53_038093 [Persea americana]